LGTLLKVVLALFILIFVGCAGLFLLAPADYEVSREITIAAPPEEIHVHVEDLKEWPAWSFWNKDYDPTLEVTYSGADKGVGAISTWTGKDGPGRMEITASDPQKGVWYDMLFGEGDAALASKGVVMYEPGPEGTTVKMIMRGAFPGAMKPLNWGADALMGPPFEASLQGLDEVVDSKIVTTLELPDDEPDDEPDDGEE
jgi:hypothetical protein